MCRKHLLLDETRYTHLILVLPFNFGFLSFEGFSKLHINVLSEFLLYLKVLEVNVINTTYFFLSPIINTHVFNFLCVGKSI